MTIAKDLINTLQQIPPRTHYCTVRSVLGLMVELSGAGKHLSVGDRCFIENRSGALLPAEVVGFRGSFATAMPFTTSLDGIAPGARVHIAESAPVIYPCDAWLGRIVGALGQPLDDKGILPQGLTARPVRGQALPAHKRTRLGGKMNTGIRAINTFLSLCDGQRMGIFAGSGVGKSTLLSMLTKGCEADVIVIGLIGERGREVQEFIEDNLGEEGLKKSVLVVATSDESALMRRGSAYMTMAVAEHFRDKGKSVLCLMDSVTRFAQAQREIGLSAGEPPTTKGYTPSVFTELPKLLERAGTGTKDSGNITGLFTVLVEGDDTNEPISDAVRGILDGHIVLDRLIAERGRFPAIDILRSVSRAMPACHDNDQNKVIQTARRYLRTYTDMEDLIRLGAYKTGTDPNVDAAIGYHPALETFLTQSVSEQTDMISSFAMLNDIFAKETQDATQPE